MKRAALTLCLLLAATQAFATATIITDPNDVGTRFETPSSTYITPNRDKTPEKKAGPTPPDVCPADEEGRTRYNGTEGVKTVEFCDGSRWVGLMKTAATADAPSTEKCAAGQESLVRYNKHKDVKAYEYCDGANWHRMGKGGLAMTSVIFDKPFVQNEKTPGLLASGFFKEDGYIGGYLACNGGINHLALHLSLGTDKTPGGNNDKVVAATAQNNSPGRNDIDHVSFFSYVPKGVPWRIWVRQNTGGGRINQAACAVKVTRFGN